MATVTVRLGDLDKDLAAVREYESERWRAQQAAAAEATALARQVASFRDLPISSRCCPHCPRD